MTRFRAAWLVALFLLLVLAVISTHGVELDKRFGDHMLLPRGRAVVIRGSAPANQSVTLTLADQKHTTIADANGRWAITLDPLTPTIGDKRLSMTLAADTTIKVADIAVGDLWMLAGGLDVVSQVRFEHDEVALRSSATSVDVRLCQLDAAVADAPRDSVAGAWSRCTPDRLRTQSAIGFVFARRIAQSLEVPVGVIIAPQAYPPSPIEAWISRPALEKTPAAKPILDFYATGGWNRQAMDTYEKQLAQWMQERQKLPLNPPEKPEPPKPFNDAKLRPAAAFNGQIAPLRDCGVTGVVWAHGDDDMSLLHAQQYGKLMPVMIADWRDAFGQPQLPFLIVQLRAERFSKYDDRCGAELRDAQTAAAQADDHAEVVVAVDLGPSPQRSVIAERTARAALGLAHSRTDHPWRTPKLTTAQTLDNRIVLTFENTGGKIVAHDGEPSGLAIAASRDRWVWADVKIDGNTITCSAPTVDHPEGVRYAYADLPPHGANLYGVNGQPLAPFSTDTHIAYTDRTVLPDEVDRYYTRKGIYVENPRLPRVCIIGDSISGGYHEPLRDMLKDEANVIGEADRGSEVWQSAGPRCYTTTGALRNDQLKNWLAERGPFDIVTFNMGIHEFASAKPGAPINGYADRLRQVVKIIREAGARPVWVNSTGTIRDHLLPRFPFYLTNCQHYNAAAAEVMTEMNVPTVDLYGLTQPNIEKLISGDHIHFNAEAKQLMAELIAETVRAELKQFWPRPAVRR